MNKIGRVLALDGETAFVRVVRDSACGSSCESCTSACESKEEIVEMRNTTGLEIGDQVEFETEDGKYLSMMLTVYGIPTALFILAIVAAYGLIPSTVAQKELMAFLAGLCSFALSFLVLRAIDKNRGK
ncbi:MAG: SoxR reducing system RseC family protein [Tissierellia bacterium]|nr:SoxR reducing system RseC family protein [Tissierellia bacterium]